MTDFVLALDRDPILQVKSQDEAASSFNRAVFGSVPKGSPSYKALEVVAAKHMDTVAVTFRESLENKVIYLDETKGEPVAYAGQLDAVSLDEWVKELLLKSEPIPEGHPVYQDGSLVVVGKTFEEVVSKKDQDVFMLVYAPWCGFSRKFLPVWQSFARAVSQVKHLVVAKMDGDQNSSPLQEDFSWTSYPHIFFVKAGTKKPIVFHGNRTVSHLVQFAEEHGSKPLDLDPRGKAQTAQTAMAFREAKKLMKSDHQLKGDRDAPLDTQKALKVLDALQVTVLGLGVGSVKVDSLMKISSAGLTFKVEADELESFVEDGISDVWGWLKALAVVQSVVRMVL
eukprot:g20166.t1